MVLALKREKIDPMFANYSLDFKRTRLIMQYVLLSKVPKFGVDGSKLYFAKR
jgi:hypothetical protein